MIDLRLSMAGAGVAALGGFSLVQQRRLHSARHDPLTGLATRALWTSRAEKAARRPRGLLLLLLDADKLKEVNDAHGHHADDVLLTAFAQRLRHWTGTSGLADRIGGDEFVAFYRPAGRDQATARLESLCACLSAPVSHGTAVLSTGASIGAVFLDELPQPTLYQAMKATDAAMYLAKRAGGRTWHLAGPLSRPHPFDMSPALRTRTHGRL